MLGPVLIECPEAVGIDADTIRSLHALDSRCRLAHVSCIRNSLIEMTDLSFRCLTWYW